MYHLDIVLKARKCLSYQILTLFLLEIYYLNVRQTYTNVRLKCASIFFFEIKSLWVCEIQGTKNSTLTASYGTVGRNTWRLLIVSNSYSVGRLFRDDSLTFEYCLLLFQYINETDDWKRTWNINLHYSTAIFDKHLKRNYALCEIACGVYKTFWYAKFKRIDIKLKWSIYWHENIYKTLSIIDTTSVKNSIFICFDM